MTTRSPVHRLGPDPPEVTPPEATPPEVTPPEATPPEVPEATPPEPRLPAAPPSAARLSAVLVALYESGGHPCLVLTRRASHLRDHAREVAFPGGRQEAADSDLWAAARREASEEVGLDPSAVRLIGRLGSFFTVGSRSQVHPFVGAIGAEPVLAPNPAEVESILVVGVRELLADDVWREEIWPPGPDGAERAMTFFELPGDTVWGVTAAILRRFLTVITGTG